MLRESRALLSADEIEENHIGISCLVCQCTIATRVRGPMNFSFVVVTQTVLNSSERDCSLITKVANSSLHDTCTHSAMSLFPSFFCNCSHTTASLGKRVEFTVLRCWVDERDGEQKVMYPVCKNGLTGRYMHINIHSQVLTLNAAKRRVNSIFVFMHHRPRFLLGTICKI